jgi:nucleoside-diphosphate-sugar epimerase
MQAGHDVLGLDTGFYTESALYPATTPPYTLLHKDIRQITPEDLAGVEAVVHMAELSNDPLGELSPEMTDAINFQGSVHLAQLAKAAGVQRFIYTSSCSVYGVATVEVVDETAALNPQTAYARCKVQVEEAVQQMGDDTFSPVFLRNATAFGASPRMRFDIVLNNLAGYAWTTREIKLLSDGSPWRPLVHGQDIAHAIGCVLQADRKIIHNQVFNVGSNAQNYRVREIAEMIATVFPGCTMTLGQSDGDNRSYRVCFDKIHNRLPGFSCQWDAKKGAQELLTVFQQVHLTEETFFSRHFTRLKQLQHLINSGQLDPSLFWQTRVH